MTGRKIPSAEKQPCRARTLRRHLTLFVLAVSLAHSVPAANIPAEPNMFSFQNGEVLRYKVKWGFIRLATIELSQKALGPSLPAQYEVLLKIKETRLKSTLNPSSLASQVFLQEEGGERTRRVTCRYEPDSGLIAMEEREAERVIARKTVPFEGVYVDLVGLIMAMRSFCSSAARVSLPTVVGCALGSTDLRFAADAQPIKLGIFRQAVLARYMTGRTDWKALGGVSGPIEAWLSDDAAAVPLKIRLNSSLGRVTLELEAIQRLDWPSPPAASPAGSTARGEAFRP